jgi:hypothetical protein
VSRRARAATLAGWLGLSLCAVAGAPAAALGVPASSAEVIALTERAADDPAALAVLRAITEVDGQPVDLEAALAGASGDQLRARLAGLERSTAAAGEPAAIADADDARHRAEEIVGGLPPAATDEGDGSEGGITIPGLGLPAPLLALLAALVVVAGLLVGREVGRRRVVEAATRASRAEDRSDPRRLEAEAVEAERRGEYAAAVRLRFQAGIERLARAEESPLRAPHTASRVVAALRSAELAELAREYERIAFGGRPARRGDAEHAREGWRRVLTEAEAR